MSHNIGSVQPVTPPKVIGPDSGNPASTGNTWGMVFQHVQPSGGTKYVILHFSNAIFPGGNRLEVDLGYSTDTFDSTDAPEFWTRPIDVSQFSGGIPIRYITSGSGNGSVTLDKYARGEGVPTVETNCDPFIPSGSYIEPAYHGTCNDPPRWDNIGCIPPANIRRDVAKSVGMVLYVKILRDNENNIIGQAPGSCSLTAIGPDTVLTAAHCIDDDALFLASSSVTFDYQAKCEGNVTNYNPIFHKVTKIFRIGSFPGDYAILQLAVPPSGLGVPSIEIRPSLPPVAEPVFVIHHPHGAVKKLSPSVSVTEDDSAWVVVQDASSEWIVVNADTASGSSGAPLLDVAGRLVGVNSHGSGCAKKFFPSATILEDITNQPGASPGQDVFLVIDRSGSMSGDAGTGRTKIEEAREAASLFIRLLETNAGHRAGLVSFATTASVDEALGDIHPAMKNTLAGPAPYSKGVLGNITPTGWTSIGAGLNAAQAEFPERGSTNRRTVLLLTDGLQNTLPMIEEAASDFGFGIGHRPITIHAVGLGTEANLDGAILSHLAQSTGGAYTRARDGLHLKKFYSLAFGDIFESGTLVDPTFDLPGHVTQSDPLTFSVCDETAITVVAGWDRREAELELSLTSPDGTTITEMTPDVVSDRGLSWTFFKIALPIGSQREGAWQATVRHKKPDDGSPVNSVDVRFFLNVTATGGPTIKSVTHKKRLYTGDTLTPLLWLGYADGTRPPNASVKLTVTRPQQSPGNLLADTGLRGPVEKSGDAIPARQATLMELEADSDKPLFTYAEETFELSADFDSNGTHENPRAWGVRLEDYLTVEGSYTFRAVASYGDSCRGSREVTWATYVSSGIDWAQTKVTTTVMSRQPNGHQIIRLQLVPTDLYGNLIGPGRSSDLLVEPGYGSVPLGSLQDNMDGSYTIDVDHDTNSGRGPGVSIKQPDRPSTWLERSPDSSVTSQTKGWWLWLLIIFLIIVIVILSLK
jgi:hypothetical protein